MTAGIHIHPLTEDRLGDLEVLFCSHREPDFCWCMWWRMPVKEHQAQGREANRSMFHALVADSDVPLGLVAYVDGAPAGWCAVGVRSSFGRVLSIPTMKSRDTIEDHTTWLVPCFFIHPAHRRSGLSAALLAAAVELATARGAEAIEGFPLAGSKARSRGSNFMTGVEPLFESCGFRADHRPSGNRVIMRREL